MGLVDAFGAEERFNIKYSELYALTEDAVKFQIALNCIRNDVPSEYARRVFNIKKESEEK